MKKKTCFISDVHLLPLSTEDERRKQDHLRGFLRHLRGHVDQLFILGDLFDFWFEYRSALPAVGGRILAELANLQESGVRVVVLAGNHDWWIGPVLTREYGLEIKHDAIWETIQGKRVYLGHGDVEGHPDGMYSFVRKVLRNRLSIQAFRLLHPDLGAWMAKRVSRSSRVATSQQPAEELIPPFYDDVVEPIFAQGADIAIFGHIHASRICVSSRGTHIVLGEWLTMGTYGEMCDGEFKLRTWRNPEGETWPLEPEVAYQH